MNRFAAKVCVVTGGGSGMGREICLSFAREGAKVAAVDIHREPVEGVVAEICKDGNEAIAVTADVSRGGDVSDAFELIERCYGGLDVLVNCAGVLAPGAVTEITEEDWDTVIDVNLKGTFLCTQAALRSMLRHQRRGKIINIASVAGKRGSGGWSGAHYAASKGGVIAFTKGVAREVAHYHINVNAVCPGPTETPALESMPHDVKEAVRNGIPLTRFGTPEDVANAVLFLASEASNYIHGEMLDVDGGVTMD